ncbi:MAG TPA: TrkA family potassium uptake protein [Frankiaceae bacterium]|nr:TrkA family potassium uptake protein [Frankiaceae bacterium]
MHVVILGCGRVGSTLARSLIKRGHSVAVIDQLATAFDRLGEDFAGQTVTGVGFDRDTLIEAGIEKADAFAAVSSGDNSNILSARVARETFGIDHVVARIYDPRRAEVYERLGIPTVATVRWTADQIMRRLLPEGTTPEWTDQSGRIILAEVPVDASWIGHPVAKLEEAAGVRVACIIRFGEGMLVEPGTALQHGDTVHLLLVRAQVNDVERAIAAGPEGAP